MFEKYLIRCLPITSKKEKNLIFSKQKLSRVLMNWIDRHSRVKRGVTIGSFRKRLLFEDDLVLLCII